MAEIINLRRARKEKARDGRAQEAAGNRAKFGRTKGEKAREAKQQDERRCLLDGAKLEQDE